MNLLTELIEQRQKLEAAGYHGPWLIVFDIDSTLMDTSPRNQAILDRAIKDLPQLVALRNAIPQLPPHWNLVDALRPHIELDAAANAVLQKYWEARFFTNEWLAWDQPYPGCPSFLHKLKSLDFRLIYLTGRHTQGMEKGTRQSFAKFGLPAGPAESFLFKPNYTDADLAFKTRACQDLSSLGSVVATFDNEPANVNRFIQIFPAARHLWLQTITSPDPEVIDPAAIAINPAAYTEMA